MYHDVDEGNPDIYNVEPARFGEQLDAISRAVGRPPAAVEDVSDGDWMITFDDGGASALYAGEELARRSWRGHFFIPTDMPQGPAGVIVFKVGKPDNQLVAFSAFSASR